MLLNNSIVAAASARIVSKLSASGEAPAQPKKPRLLPAAAKDYIADARTNDDIGAFERAVGTNDLLSLYYFWSGLHASRSVGRIMIAAGVGEPSAAATGFLIAPGLLMTNWHVFQTPETASRARVQFGYEADENGAERKSTWFSLNPGIFFISDEHLDYAVVHVDVASQEGPDSLNSFSWLRLNPNLGKTTYGQYLSIIQHPEALPKQVAIRENKLLPFDDSDDFLTYQSDTFKGSSGSPVFNDFWEVVALHHSGKPATDAVGHYLDRNGVPITDHKPSEDEIQWIANEGARTSRIVSDILKKAPAGEQRTLLEDTFSGKLEAATPWRAVPVSQSESTPVDVISANAFVAYLPLNVSLRVESLDHKNLVPADVKPAPAPAQVPMVTSNPAEPQFESLNFDHDYDDRRGYDAAFLGRKNQVPMPTILKSAQNQIARLIAGGTQLDYHHYSAFVHKARRIPALTAGNVDYEDDQRGGKKRDAYGKDQWIADSRMDPAYQLPKGFYDRWKRLDYGHLVRREDNCWGASAKEIEYSNSDTFHLTNCTPQHESFNRSNLKGLWGLLENAIGDQSKKDKGINRVSIFAGPIFNDQKDLVCKDKEGDILVPLEFWKVVVAPLRKGGFGAYGFILSQEAPLDDNPPFEDFSPPDNFVAQHQYVTLAAIESKTIVRFDKSLKAADILAKRGDGTESLIIHSVEDLKLPA